MLTKKCRYCLHDAVHMVVSSSQKYFRECLWCPWLYRRAFLCFLSEVGAYLPPFVLRITDSASDGARSWRSRVCSAEEVDKLRLGHEAKASPWAKFVIFKDFFVTETTGKSCKTTRSSPKMPIFFQTNKLRPSPLSNEHCSFETKCR